MIIPPSENGAFLGLHVHGYAMYETDMVDAGNVSMVACVCWRHTPPPGTRCGNCYGRGYVWLVAKKLPKLDPNTIPFSPWRSP